MAFVNEVLNPSFPFFPPTAVVRPLKLAFLLV